MGSRSSSACSLILLVSLASLMSLAANSTVGAAACTCPSGGQYYARIYTIRDGWLYDVCVISFDSSGYYAYAAVCGTTTSSTTTTTTSFTQVTTVISKTILGVQFSGLKVKVDRQYYTTPFALPLQDGRGHTFIAPSTVTINGLTYSFVRWEDSRGRVLSTGTSFRTYTLGRTFYVVYEPPHYTLTVFVKDARTSKLVAGASVYLDSSFMGTTDSRGVVVIQKVYAGWHYLGVTKYAGYLPYWATVSVRASTLTVYLTPL